nr:PQQ-dependent sugar dehydrogenase [Chitinophagaceae bacterium]
GLMLVSNIGQANLESLYIVHKADDFGWPLREGPFMLDFEGDMSKIYALPANDSIFHFTYPAVQFDHDEGNAISGGFEYNGVKAKQLKGKYIFGDVVSGKLFFVEMKNLKDGSPSAIHQFKASVKGKVKSLRDICGDSRVDLRFAKDSHGEIYILTKADGMIYQLRDP